MTRFQSLAFYLSLFVLSSFCMGKYQKIYNKIGYKNKTQKKREIILLIIAIVPIVCMQGFRQNIGTDYWNYSYIFNQIGTGNSAVIREYANEPIFLLENIILSKLSNNTALLFCVDSILINAILYKCFIYYRDKIDMQVAYFLFYCIVSMMFINIERQGIACLIIWYSFRYIHEQNFKKYCLICILAAGFHTSALFFIPMYFVTVVNNGSNKFAIKIVSIMAIFITPLMITAIVNNLKSTHSDDMHYLGSSGSMKFTAFLYLAMFYIPTLYAIFFLKKKNVLSLSLNQFKLSFHLLFICDIMSIISMSLDGIIKYGSRLCFYTYFGLIIGAAASVKQIQSNEVRKCVKLYFVIAGIVYFIRIFYIIGQAQVFPYQHI